MEVSVQLHAAAVLDSMLTLRILLSEDNAFITLTRGLTSDFIFCEKQRLEPWIEISLSDEPNRLCYINISF